MLKPILQKNDKKWKTLIFMVSIVIFLVVVSLGRITPPPFPFDFDVHVFAFINSVINSVVSVLLILAFIAVINKKYQLHKNLMLIAMGLSIVFLVFYIGHHLFAGDTLYGDFDKNKVLDDAEKQIVGGFRYFYYVILISHIILAAVMLPFILFTAYRALTGEYSKHKKLAKITWPLWLYIAITGVLVYWMIEPFY